jgi:hypothetical protein
MSTVVQTKRAWWPEGPGLPQGYSHHPGLHSGPYKTCHVVCRVVDTDPGFGKIVWQAVGRDVQHALELAWQHHENEPLDEPVAVWEEGGGFDDWVEPDPLSQRPTW